MKNPPRIYILDHNGNPLPPTARDLPNRAMALANAGNLPFDSADYNGSHFAGWNPFLWSPDAERSIYRDRIVSRHRDLVNNDGWAAGAITRVVDNVIGALFRPVSKPDYQALYRYTGNRAFDSVWAEDFSNAADTYFRVWANDIGCYCDSARRMNFSQLMRLAFSSKMITGDCLGLLRWLPERIGEGRAHYATALQLIDPDRLSNPQLKFDTQTLRGGVEVDDNDVAIAYHIRRAHQGDWFSAAKAQSWDRVQRETAWGRPIIVHDFDSQREGQHRGGVGILNPVVKRLKMLLTYDSKALERAIVDAMFGAYLRSPFDHQLFAEAFGVSGGEINAYQDSRAAFHADRKITLGDTKIPTLYPGEDVVSVSSNQPSANFEAFESAFLRNIAAGTGLSAQQISQNWSDVNYSSARGALLEAWKTLHPRRVNFASGFADPIRAAWLEESMEVDAYPMPNGAPSFAECRTAYARCLWMGPGKGVIDVTKEREGSLMAMSMGLSTLEMEAADQGLNWEEVLDQRAKEIKAFQDRGLQPPEWSGTVASPPIEDRTAP